MTASTPQRRSGSGDLRGLTRPTAGRAVMMALVAVSIAVLLPSLAAAAAHRNTLSVPAVEPDADTLTIRPGTQTVEAGQDFSVEIKIEGDAAVTASDVQILFDTAYLEGMSVVHSGVFDSYFVDQSNLAAGLVWFGGGTFGSRTPPFTFVTLNFRARGVTGTTQLQFNATETDIQGIGGSVLGGLSVGTINIVPLSTPTATPTRTATSSVTPTPSVTFTPSATPTRTATPTPAPGQLCVMAFDDENGNLVREPGERLLADAIIAVRTPDMCLLHRVTTDGSTPRCLLLPAGTYYLEETDPPAYASTGPNWWGVTLLAGASVTIPFADRRIDITYTPTPTPTSTRPPGGPTDTPNVAVTATPSSTASIAPDGCPTGMPSPLPRATPGLHMYLPLLLRQGVTPSEPPAGEQHPE